eukprot:TRINITY_DN42683_c0_g1_i1.p1 TRINITY_DN42683_c0_g1~~TRINITY_DN42683_c0_g1_i1.p1  ORF type:complete len:1169 (-),score=244.46 TRINITY_DN42683_c0_g1_i1:112-3618(-)
MLAPPGAEPPRTSSGLTAELKRLFLELGPEESRQQRIAQTLQRAAEDDAAQAVPWVVDRLVTYPSVRSLGLFTIQELMRLFPNVVARCLGPSAIFDLLTGLKSVEEEMMLSGFLHAVFCCKEANGLEVGRECAKLQKVLLRRAKQLDLKRVPCSPLRLCLTQIWLDAPSSRPERQLMADCCARWIADPLTMAMDKMPCFILMWREFELYGRPESDAWLAQLLLKELCRDPVGHSPDLQHLLWPLAGALNATVLKPLLIDIAADPGRLVSLWTCLALWPIQAPPPDGPPWPPNATQPIHAFLRALFVSYAELPDAADLCRTCLLVLVMVLESGGAAEGNVVAAAAAELLMTLYQDGPQLPNDVWLPLLAPLERLHPRLSPCLPELVHRLQAQQASGIDPAFNGGGGPLSDPFGSNGRLNGSHGGILGGHGENGTGGGDRGASLEWFEADPGGLAGHASAPYNGDHGYGQCVAGGSLGSRAAAPNGMHQQDMYHGAHPKTNGGHHHDFSANGGHHHDFSANGGPGDHRQGGSWQDQQMAGGHQAPGQQHGFGGPMDYMSGPGPGPMNNMGPGTGPMDYMSGPGPGLGPGPMDYMSGPGPGPPMDYMSGPGPGPPMDYMSGPGPGPPMVYMSGPGPGADMGMQMHPPSYGGGGGGCHGQDFMGQPQPMQQQQQQPMQPQMHGFNGGFDGGFDGGMMQPPAGMPPAPMPMPMCDPGGCMGPGGCNGFNGPMPDPGCMGPGGCNGFNGPMPDPGFNMANGCNGTAMPMPNGPGPCMDGPCGCGNMGGCGPFQSAGPGGPGAAAGMPVQAPLAPTAASLALQIPDGMPVHYGGVRVGLQNTNNTCYMNSFMQSLFMTNSFLFRVFAFMLELKKNPSKVDKEDYELGIKIVEQMKRLMAKMQCTSHPNTDIIDLLAVFPDIYRSGEQQDVTETIRYIFDKLGGYDQALVRDVFAGELTEKFACQVCGKVKEKAETFSDIVLTVPKEDEVKASHVIPSIQKLVNQRLAFELLDEDSKLFCDACQVNTRAGKWCEITSPPTHLCICLNRFTFNVQAMNFTKEKTPVQVSGSLQIGPFCYDLYMVIIHTGKDASSGHYYAMGRRSEAPEGAPNDWMTLDDSQIKPADMSLLTGNVSEKMKDDNPYVLFYRCQQAPPTPQLRIPGFLVEDARREDIKRG